MATDSQAFFISEAARRTRFEENIFNLAFYRAFGGFDNSKPVETKLLKYFAQNPHALDTLDGLADIYISREDYAEAKRYLLLAIQETRRVSVYGGPGGSVARNGQGGGR